MQVVAIRPRRPHHRGKPAVADRKSIRQCIVKRQLLSVVVAHCFGFMRPRVSDDKAIIFAAVPLLMRRGPVVRRVRGRKRLQLRHRHRHAQRTWVLLAAAQAIGAALAGVLAVGAQRAQVVVKRAVLHHQHHDRVDARQQLRRGRLGGHRLIGRTAQVGRRLAAQVRCVGGRLRRRRSRGSGAVIAATADSQRRQADPKLQERGAAIHDS